MNKMIKAFTGCLLALAIFTSCDPGIEHAVESEDKPVIESRRIYDDVGEVVFHDYVPSEKRVSTYRDYYFTNTTWTPVTIVEVSGMRKRFEDQGFYEMHWLHEKVSVQITDGLDGEGNVVECDFIVYDGRVSDG